jgi:hypothetical protein
VVISRPIAKALASAAIRADAMHSEPFAFSRYATDTQGVTAGGISARTFIVAIFSDDTCARKVGDGLMSKFSDALPGVALPFGSLASRHLDRSSGFAGHSFVLAMVRVFSNFKFSVAMSGLE